MITYNLVPRDQARAYSIPAYTPVSRLKPVRIDGDYFDKLAALGLACLAAAIVGNLVMASLYGKG